VAARQPGHRAEVRVRIHFENVRLAGAHAEIDAGVVAAAEQAIGLENFELRIGQQRIKGLREDPDRIATVSFDRRAATVHEKP